MKVGDKVSIFGRIQSRNYEKHYEDGSIEQKTAYEISIIKVFAGDNSQKEYNPLLSQMYENSDTANGATV